MLVEEIAIFLCVSNRKKKQKNNNYDLFSTEDDLSVSLIETRVARGVMYINRVLSNKNGGCDHFLFCDG